MSKGTRTVLRGGGDGNVVPLTRPLRRRQRYGTVIADLEEHKIIDLLPDRTAPTLAAWLGQQPQIEIVSRDRATEYARGITEGAPQAVHVADRWHVLRNLREAAERVLDAHRAQWQDITLPEAMDRVPPVRRSQHEQVARQARREQRQERYAAVRALHAQGMPLLQIARHLQMGRATVRATSRRMSSPSARPIGANPVTCSPTWPISNGAGLRAATMVSACGRISKPRATADRVAWLRSGCANDAASPLQRRRTNTGRQSPTVPCTRSPIALRLGEPPVGVLSGCCCRTRRL